MPANSMINSTFQKIGVFGRTQRGNRMLRILLADDDPVFLSRMEHLLMLPRDSSTSKLDRIHVTI